MDFKLEDFPGEDLSAWFEDRHAIYNDLDSSEYDNIELRMSTCKVCGALVRADGPWLDDDRRPLHIKFHRSLGQQP